MTTFRVNIRWVIFVFAFAQTCFSWTGSSLRAQGLSKLATNAGINFGAGITYQQFTEKPDSLFKATLNKDFNMYFEGNKLKLKNVQAVRGVFDFSTYDSVLVMAEKNGKTVRGHCLIWHSIGQNPGWLRAGWEGSVKWTRAQLLDIMKTHITTVVGHYKGRIQEWDVVNEGVYIENGHPNGLRKSYWQQIIGDDYIDSAFVWAHRADPNAYLYFNEFGAEASWSAEYAKRDSVYNLMKRLLARGIPVHGVGFQCHFGNYINAGSISANIRKLGELGLRVSMTEIDMKNTTNLPGNWKALMNAALENYNCTSFVTCGVDDGHSWFGKDCGCLAWDSVMVAKASIYKALSDALTAANPTISAKRKAFAALPPASPKLVVPAISAVDLAILPDSKKPQIIIDNTDAACTTDSLWTMTTYSPGYFGTNYMHDGNERLNVERWAKWTPKITKVANYRIFMRWVSGSNRPNRAPVQIRHAKGDTTLYLNQMINGGRWVCLGTYTLNPGSLNFVKLIASNPGFTTADAVMFEEQTASTGIAQNVAESGAVAYPQPFAQSTTIRLKNNEPIRSVIVYKASGEMVENISDIDSRELALGESWAPGFYLLVVKSENGLYNLRLIKTK